MTWPGQSRVKDGQDWIMRAAHNSTEGRGAKITNQISQKPEMGHSK